MYDSAGNFLDATVACPDWKGIRRRQISVLKIN